MSTPYIGPERRVADRRVTPDRRSSVRMELNNPDRRKNFGRRSTDTFYRKDSPNRHKYV